MSNGAVPNYLTITKIVELSVLVIAIASSGLGVVLYIEHRFNSLDARLSKMEHRTDCTIRALSTSIDPTICIGH